jgi:hypothetical protein
MRWWPRACCGACSTARRLTELRRRRTPARGGPPEVGSARQLDQDVGDVVARGAQGDVGRSATACASRPSASACRTSRSCSWCRPAPPPAAASVATLVALALAGRGGGSTTTTTVTRPTPAPAPGAADRAADLQCVFVERSTRRRRRSCRSSPARGSALASSMTARATSSPTTTSSATAGHSPSPLSGGDRHRATFVGRFAPDDLAFIRLREGSPPAARFGDSAKLDVGDLMLAIGNPRPALQRGPRASCRRSAEPAARAAASGEALVNLTGRSWASRRWRPSTPSSAKGIGFAIPSGMVKQVAPQLIDHGKVTCSGRAYLGVEVALWLTPPSIVVAGSRPMPRTIWPRSSRR